jgi:hypothetical protein
VRGIQLDSGFSASFGGILGLIPSPVNFSYSIQLDPPPDRTMAAPMATFMWPYPDVLEGTLAGPACEGRVQDQNALQYVSQRLRGMSNAPAAGMDDALAAEMAATAQPLFDMLANAGIGGPGPEVPAASNADFFAEFLASPGTQPIAGALGTTADGIASAFVDASLKAGDDPMALIGAATGTIAQVNGCVPSVIGQAALINEAGASVQAGAELSDLAERRVPDGKRFVASEIRRIVVNAGETAHVELRSQEVADLVSRSVADVVGRRCTSRRAPAWGTVRSCLGRTGRRSTSRSTVTACSCASTWT